MPRCLWLLTSVFLLACISCSQPPAEANSVPESGSEILATVTRVELEGGFFGLVAEDGRRYDPVHLPAAFRIDGLAVRARIKNLPPQVGYHMWGKRVELLGIERR